MLALAVLLIFAYQPPLTSIVTIIADDQIMMLQTNERVPSALLDQAGLKLNANDRVLLHGLAIAPDQPITHDSITLEIRRAIPIDIITPEGEKQIRSSAFTVGEALQEASVWLRAGDKVHPPLYSPLSQTPISMLPARDLTITAHGQTLQTLSSAQTVGEALAEAGIPLLWLDYSLPAEDQPLPADGQIRFVRLGESVLLAQKPIPFESELQASADVPLDQTQTLQPGEPGLSVERIRIRYEDGKEVSRLTEDETLVRPPRTRVLGYGTKVEVKTATVDGVQLEYWRAVPMYATSYSPCRSGTEECHPGTSSGKALRKGMVALRYDWYLAMQGQRLYIPGYGFATVEDVCGGCVGQPWIDLGYSDHDFEHWSSWVTVYFLTPVPANVIHVLE